MTDKETFELVIAMRTLALDEASCKTGLNLTASESCLSRTAESFLASPLSEKYHLGKWGFRTFDDETLSLTAGLARASLPGVSMIEKMATTKAIEKLSCGHIDFRPLSGLHATICTISTLSKPGDLILSISPEKGGHGATGNLIKTLGRLSMHLPFSSFTNDIDLQASKRIIKKSGPKMVMIDLGLTPKPLSIGKLKKLLPSGSILAYDASHNLGLIFGGAFPNPLLNGADVLFGNTHKSFPGPQKGFLAFKKKSLGVKVSGSVGSFLVSSQHTGDTLALYISILEMSSFCESYARQTLHNANMLAREIQNRGFTVLWPDNNVIMSGAFWCENPVSNSEPTACRILSQSGIFINERNFQGRNCLRIGAQYITRQGMQEKEMVRIADLFQRALIHREKPAQIRDSVQKLVTPFSQIRYSFDSVFRNFRLTN